MVSLLLSPAARGLLLAVMVFGAFLAYGTYKYREGVKDTTAQFMEADRKGAENARDTAKKVLDGIGSGVDPDSLLNRTNGLRD